MKDKYIKQGAKLFAHVHKTYEEQFLVVLKAIVQAYKKMLIKSDKLENDENAITLKLYEYLTNPKFIEENELEAFTFNVEVNEQSKNDITKTTGRTDIKIEVCPTTNFNPSQYFIIECKRLDGNNKDKRIKQKRPYKKISLAVEYIKNGIMRFVQKDKYPTPLGINGMIGFVVEKHDIDKGIEDINNLLKERFDEFNTIQFLTKKDDIIVEFEYAYLSTHKGTDDKNFRLVHLMLDFSSIIT